MHVTWASGHAYERYVGRWSRPVAAEFVRWLGLPRGLDWMDVGCGTGALAEAIFHAGAPRVVRGCDLSPEHVAAARARVGGAGTV